MGKIPHQRMPQPQPCWATLGKIPHLSPSRTGLVLTLELTKARRYLEVRWGELLGPTRSGARQDLAPSHAREGSALAKNDRHRFRQLAANREVVVDLIRTATGFPR